MSKKIPRGGVISDSSIENEEEIDVEEEKKQEEKTKKEEKKQEDDNRNKVETDTNHQNQNENTNNHSNTDSNTGNHSNNSSNNNSNTGGSSNNNSNTGGNSNNNSNSGGGTNNHSGTGGNSNSNTDNSSGDKKPAPTPEKKKVWVDPVYEYIEHPAETVQDRYQVGIRCKCGDPFPDSGAWQAHRPVPCTGEHNYYEPIYEYETVVIKPAWTEKKEITPGHWKEI